ncbi:hypothetical protein BLA15816_04068 [Burkholderia lata]|nr:hypothetical protein BLA15816_04068 [Burkholderia lata]
MLRKGAAAGSGRCRAADWCPIFVRRCTIGVNAKLSQCERSFNLRPSSDAPRNEFAGGERGDNRGTKCPDPKALLDGIQQRFFICVHGFALMVHRPAQWPHSALAFAPRFFRASPRPPVFPVFRFPTIRSQTMRSRALAVRANPVGVRKTRPLHSAFADRTVGKIGRQFSYKQNAEEGVRLDEQRRTMDRGRKGGWCRSFVVGLVCRRRGLPEPFCGL